jgi:hypothetical protein
MLRIVIRTSRAGAVLATGALLLGACSSGVTHAPGANGPSVSSLISSMKDGFAHASSVRVSGTLTEQGKTVTLDLGMLASGDMSGKLTVDATQLTLLVTSGKAYELVTKAFFKTIQQSSHVPDSLCAKMCGKYLAVPGSAFASFDFPSIRREIEKKLPVPSSAPHVTSTTYNGVAAYKLSGQGVALYVAAHGTHYLLAVAEPSKFGTLNFSDWNAVAPVSPPPASQIYTTS